MTTAVTAVPKTPSNSVPSKMAMTATNAAMNMEVSTSPEVLPSGYNKAGTPAGKEPKVPKASGGGVKRARKETTEPTHTTDETGTTSMTIGDKTEPVTQNYLIVAKSVRTFLKNLPTSCHCGADALPTLNTKVTEMLIEASQRAHSNGRKTIKSSDF